MTPLVIIRSQKTSDKHSCRRWLLSTLAASLLSFFALAPSCPAGEWIDAGWTFRRPIAVEWNSDKAAGNELAMVQFYTAGHARPNGDDIRVATDEGRIVPSHVLMVGPGDQISVVFSLAKGERKYYVFFGNSAPPAPPRGTEDVVYHCGLLMDTHVWPGGNVETAEQLQHAWDRAKEPIGKTMVDRLFIGFNPFDDRQQIISKFTGSLFVPIDGSYEFAGSVNHRGALYLDDKLLLWIPRQTGDIRFSAKIDLKRGPHDISLLAATFDGDPRISIGWQRPDTAKVDVIAAESFGVLGHAAAGALEERGKQLTADFKCANVAECFYASHYSYRYKFEAALPPGLPKGAPFKVDWDFGDGQTAAGINVEHVYLADGDVPLTIKVSLGSGTDTQTTRLAVRRNRADITHPPTDEPPAQSAIVAKYDLTKLPDSLLPWAVMLHQHARAVPPMVAAATRLAARSGEKDLDSGLALQAMEEATDEAQTGDKVAAMINAWDATPPDSRLQPRAAEREASLLLYRTGEFDQALKLLQPYAKKPNAPKSLLRLYGQALVLANQPDEGRRVLSGIPIEAADREAAISGAMARTVEFFITEGDWESGEEAWHKWQSRYPAEFLEGYSVLLETRLMELAKCPDAAAKVAEAFAISLPRSPYASRLLDRASKLLAKSDAKKSASLHALLKQKYPEDPLSQD